MTLTGATSSVLIFVHSKRNSITLLTNEFHFHFKGYSWQIIGPESSFPYSSAVRAGRDADGTTIYVGRVFHEGDMIPAKVHPDRRVAIICFQGEEIAKEDYEVLRSGEFVWEFACNGEIPIGAVVIGKTADGEDLYSGRCLYRGTQTPGKVSFTSVHFQLKFC